MIRHCNYLQDILTDHFEQAHAMLPHLGAGAGQGIEDAEVLSRLLSHPQTNLENVAVRYHLHASNKFVVT